jgi:hypothetical protein
VRRGRSQRLWLIIGGPQCGLYTTARVAGLICSAGGQPYRGILRESRHTPGACARRTPSYSTSPYTCRESRVRTNCGRAPDTRRTALRLLQRVRQHCPRCAAPQPRQNMTALARHACVSYSCILQAGEAKKHRRTYQNCSPRLGCDGVSTATLRIVENNNIIARVSPA